MKLNIILIFKSIFGLMLIFMDYSTTIAQNIIIHGNAHPVYWNNSNRVAYLYSYADYITYQEIMQDKDSLDNKGRFTLRFYANCTQPVIIKIKNAVAKLYVEPPSEGIREYIIKLHPPDSIQVNTNDITLNANISILTYDTLELNSLIFDFNKIYNKYLDEAMYKFLNRSVLFKKLDSILIEAKSVFKEIPNSYFQNYIDYNIANININATRDRSVLANIFLIKKPVQINNYEYMQFFNAFFKDYLIADITRQTQQTIYYIINKSTQIKQLYEFVKDDKVLNSNDTLKELVLIQNLYHFYFNEKFNPYSVQILLEQLLTTTRYDTHKKILQNIIQELNRLKQGTPAPNFVALTRDSTLFELYSINKQFVYLNFFSIKSPNSLKELREIQLLSDKFGSKVKFISICVDESYTDFKAFIQKNTSYKHLILWNYQPPDDFSAKTKYNVKATPLCFLINTDKTLMLSPAPAPSDGIYYHFQKMFGKKNANQLPY